MNYWMRKLSLHLFLNKFVSSSFLHTHPFTGGSGWLRVNFCSFLVYIQWWVHLRNITFKKHICTHSVYLHAFYPLSYTHIHSNNPRENFCCCCWFCCVYSSFSSSSFPPYSILSATNAPTGAPMSGPNTKTHHPFMAILFHPASTAIMRGGKSRAGLKPPCVRGAMVEIKPPTVIPINGGMSAAWWVEMEFLGWVRAKMTKAKTAVP
mmetsp:Transcript_5263/g.8142  ORF Transcript_5263/g.8142 Transcript_5263/m.8142 type:complete len:207 (+) Transcript_5263:59-679(+)